MTQIAFGPGDVVQIPPGHEARTVGDEPLIFGTCKDSCRGRSPGQLPDGDGAPGDKQEEGWLASHTLRASFVWAVWTSSWM